MRGRLRWAGLVAGLIFWAAPAQAQALWPGGPESTTPLVPGQLFAGFGGQLGVYHLPKFDSPWRSSATATGGDTFRPSSNPDPIVGGPGGVFGYVFHDGTFPSWLGRKVRLSVGAQLWGGNFTADHTHTGSGTGIVSAAPIDGSTGSNLLYNSATLRQASFDIDTSGYELSLRLTSDVPVAARVTLSPFVSLFGGQSREAYSVRAALLGTNTVAPYSLDERMSSTRVGAMVGTGVTVRVVPRLSVHLGAQVGLYWLNARMTGGDCYSPAVVTLGTACAAGPIFGRSFRTSVSDTRSTVGFRGGLTGGVAWDMRFAVLSLSGFLAYDSHVPGISNPQVTAPITTLGPGLTTSGRARLVFDDAVNYGAMVVLRVPLSGPGR